MPTALAQADALYTQLQRRLIESGEWDRIRSNLSTRLSESGWCDDLRHRSKERSRTMEPLSFQTLLDENVPHAQSALPLAVKRDITTQIRRWLEKQIS